MNAIMIREYREGDWPRIAEIHDSARRIELELAGLADAFIPLERAAEAEGLFDYTVRVALVEGCVAGFVAYSGDELAWLYVDPARMRSGIGRALIGYVLENVAERPLNIEVLAGNVPAVRAYEAMGFETVEMLTGKMPGNETFEVTAHHMRKA